MAEADATVNTLRCEYLHDPIGIDVRRPRLSWVIQSSRRNWTQRAYQVQVASSLEKLQDDTADLWDSGRVESNQSIQVVYDGRPLTSRMQCWWRVRVWDERDELTDWSESAYWSMGLLNSNDWQAAWIGSNSSTEDAEAGLNRRLPWLRKTFSVPGKPALATVYVNTVGYHELFINGEKIGDDVLSPLVSAYAKRSFYVTYDVTDRLRAGENCIAVWLGSGWHGRMLAEASDQGPVVRAQLEWKDESGKMHTIATDDSWRSHPSPITPIGANQGTDYGGERYDAREEMPGWNTADFDDSQWKAAQLCNPHVQAVLAQPAEPNRIIETITPVGIERLDERSFLVDMGKNFAGWIEILFRGGSAGQEVLLEYADKRFDDGRLQTYGQRDIYVMRGTGEERFRNRFSYQAFRWLRISGLSEPPGRGDIKGHLIHTGYEPAAEFSCSNPLLNDIYETTLWTYRSLSLGGYVVDCPTRERLGYGGDSGASMETGLMNFDLAAMFTKWLGDWRADQAPNGDLPHTSPNAVPAGGGPAWGGFVVALPWHLYLQYGDTRVLEETYPNIRNWLAFLETNVKNGLLQPYVGIGHPRAKWSFLGDWVPPGRDQAANRVDERSTLFFNNCYMIYNLRLATKIAGVLGETEDVRQYEKRANELATEAHEQFFNVDEATYANGEQPYLAMPLLFDLVPDELESKIMDSLEDAILVKNEGHLNTGMHGTYYLLKWLTEADRNDLAYEIVSKETYPSWGFMLRNGATTIWEEWNGDNSQIHNTLISVGGWFIQGLAGIQYDEQTPGFKHFTIQPSLPDDLSHVSGQYRSIHGTIRAGWVRRVNELGMTVEVPANTSATVIIPAEHPDRVMERDQPVSRAEGVRKVDFADGRARVLVGSGSYRFTTVLPKK